MPGYARRTRWCSRAGSVPVRLLRLLRPLVVVVHRHRIGPGEPAVEVAVGAALRAERPELVLCRLAADRAFLRARARGHVIHADNVVIVGAVVKSLRPSPLAVIPAVTTGFLASGSRT